ncbi:hypothetical protein CK203_025343 [Vitis vinifera]|uniref:Uncharacterized protein n=1 Tax=Vitis vinifera TaxID=29760 RepID=A0A438IZN0_VITVI|nr:hypothetical protein CK203_025343 [Vitis vinifera]
MAPPRLDLLVHGLLCVDPLHLPLLPKALSQTLELPKTQGLHLFIEASLPAISHNSGSSSHIPPFIHDSISISILINPINNGFIPFVDVYLLGTVMLVFGMGLYELFVSNLDLAKSLPEERNQQRSSLFGLFTLQERPQWLEIKSVNELKTKLGHVIVMLLLIGLFEKSKKAAILTPVDLLCFAASILLSSVCLYLLSKLHGSK